MNSERRNDCPMRHPENGNCLPAGGFCTAVNDIICDALHGAYGCGRFDLLNQNIANGVTVQEWIPVTERLPEQDFKVLVYGGEELLYVNGILQPTPCAYTGYLYDIDPEPCFFTWDKPQNVIKNVTHWMPIPRPPKGECS